MTAAGDGLLLVDKPAGPTSHDVVARLRAAVGGGRTGHTGTIDPPATGLLLLLLGRATRLARYIPDAPKLYEGFLRFGVATTTDDLAGEVTYRHAGPLPAFSEIEGAASRFLGSQVQVPPAVSARKVGGVRLYRRTRRGTTAAEAPGAPIEVARFALSATADPAICAFRLDVSSGTYVRALARDLGQALGCGAAVATLRRTAIGPFEVRNALPLPDSGPLDPTEIVRRVIGVDAIPLTVPSIRVDDPADARRFGSGVRLPRPVERLGCDGFVAVRDGRGRLLGIAEATVGELKPRVVLPGTDAG